MFDRLEDLLIRFEEIMSELNEPFVVNDQTRFQKLMKGPGPGVHVEEVRLHIVRHLHALSRKAPAGPQPDGGAHSGKDQQQA